MFDSFLLCFKQNLFKRMPLQKVQQSVIIDTFSRSGLGVPKTTTEGAKIHRSMKWLNHPQILTPVYPVKFLTCQCKNPENVLISPTHTRGQQIYFFWAVSVCLSISLKRCTVFSKITWSFLMNMSGKGVIQQVFMPFYNDWKIQQIIYIRFLVCEIIHLFILSIFCQKDSVGYQSQYRQCFRSISIYPVTSKNFEPITRCR